MFVILRQGLARSRFAKLSSLCESNVVFSLPLLHFCTSGERQSVSVPRPTVSVYDFLVHKHHFSPESASQVATIVARLKHPERSDSVLAFLKESGFSHSQLERTLMCVPKLLSGSLDENIKPKIKAFQDFGISADEAARIIANDPYILTRSLRNKLIPGLTVLKNLFGSIRSAQILKVSGWFLFSKLDDSLVPNFELLKKYGVSMDHIFWVMNAYPRFLLRKPKKMKTYLDKVDEMGIRRDSKLFLVAANLINSYTDKNWDLKLGDFREMGFSDNDIVAAFRASPTVFGLSKERINKSIKVLLKGGKYNMSCIVGFPVCLTYSVEKRLTPRMQVLESLEGRNLIQSWPSLSTFCTMTNKKFHEKYVAPFVDEIGDAFLAKNAATG